MGYIESYALFITNYIHGEDENARQLRRTLARYLCLTQVFVFRDISIQVKKRFPTTDSMINAGILLREEKEKLHSIELQYDKYWAPIRWIHSEALKARKEETITSDLLYWKLCAEVDKFRHNLQLLCNYDWIPIPLVYSQLDLVVLMMTIIEFVFFTGWLKVAQALLNPFGDDDDDFECIYLIDKNFATSLCIADNYDRLPKIRPDPFWRSNKRSPASPSTALVGVNFKITSNNQASWTRDDLQTIGRGKIMNIASPHSHHLEESTNRKPLRLAQNSTFQINHSIPLNLSMNNDDNNELLRYKFPVHL
ncbi:unnamed protein product [Litomosoides sigmodontis]|uniref:Bestrophin homolog n=1 Tax=Litomosoides sigmodontis TaxID=42156 RepID=A0A3P6S582_LITSI|nr:unnamed protein product [Litomosoides sigmodontis]